MSIKTAAGSDWAGLTSGFPNKVDVTIMLWAFMSSGPGSTNTRSIVSLASASDDCWDLEMQANVGDTIDHFGSYSSGPSQDQIGTTSVTKSAWHNLAVTISAGGVLKTYIDGVADITAGGSSTGITPSGLRVGQSVAGDDTWAGLSLYGLKIWNVALTAAEITAEQASYSAVKLTSLYGSWLLSTVTALTDSSGNGHNLTRNGTSFTNDTDPPALGSSIALTGAAGTAALGTAAASNTHALTGNAGTSAAGTVSPSVAFTAALTGAAATAARGTLGITVDGSQALTGAAASSSAGSTSPSTSVAIVSSQLTGSSGSLASSISIALTGAATTASPGSIIAGIVTSAALTGSVATAAPGSLGLRVDGSQALTGAAAAAARGTISPQVDGTVALTGGSATSGAGSVSISVGASIALTGISTIGSAGTVLLSADGEASLTGFTARLHLGRMAPPGVPVRFTSVLSAVEDVTAVFESEYSITVEVG